MRSISRVASALSLFAVFSGAPAIAASPSPVPNESGAPRMQVANAFLQSGGGAFFDAGRAIRHTIGVPLLDSELGILRKRFGDADVASWLASFTAVGKSALARSPRLRAALAESPPAALVGKHLLLSVVGAGVDAGGTFHTSLMLDTLFGAGGYTDGDATFHRVGDRALVEFAHRLGEINVKFATSR